MKKITDFLYFIRGKFNSKLNVALLLILVVLIIGGGVLFANLIKPTKVVLPIQEVDMSFDPNGPYAILEPRRDGNAIILNIKRVSGYQKIAYELAYQSNLNSDEQADGGNGSVERGVQGEIQDVDGSKSEYSQEILFGTCSKGDTFSTLHCVFDTGVEFGTLTLRIYENPAKDAKVQKVYKFVIPWRLQKPDVALGKIFSADNHFGYITTASRGDLANIGYTIVQDLSGAPKLDDQEAFLGKVYALNVPTAKQFPSGTVTMELADSIPDGATIAEYSSSNGKWENLKSTISKSTIQAVASDAGFFAIVKTK